MSTCVGKIEKLLRRSISCWKKGLYRDSYTHAHKAFSLCGEGVQDELILRVMLNMARCSYLTGRFEESRKYLSAITEKYLTRNCPMDRTSVALEVAIIEANIARRSGDLTGAISILSRFDDIDVSGVKPELLAEKYLIEGAVYYYLNNTSESDRRIELAIGMSARCGDERLRARVLALMGLLAGCRGIIRAAEDYFSRAGKISRSLGDLYGEACVQLNLSVLHCREGRFKKARKEAERARELFEAIGWMVGATRSYIALGNICRLEEDLDSAARAYTVAIEMAEKYAGTRELVMAREGLGDIEIDRCNFDDAERMYLENLEVERKLARNSEIVIGTLRRLGELYMRLGKQEEARGYLREALRCARNLSDSLEIALAIRGLADTYFDDGRRTKAIRMYNRVFGLLRRISADFELAKTHLFYAEVISSSGTDDMDIDGEEIHSSAGDVPRGEALRNLLIAESIFKTIEVASWIKRTRSLISQLIKKVESPSLDFPNIAKRAKLVRIHYSKNFFPYKGFAVASKSMLEVLEQARFSAGFNRPVLITGETGTGKELIARLIHGLSHRAHRAFVAVNCAAIPDHLFESEFFGHRRGCFTGALTDRKGLFEEANGGTLFLDEVGELTTLQQVKFLRVLQEGKIRRVGENRERVVDVRIISATNRNIDEEVINKSFRDDFYFRINAERIHIPPLRERPEDILAVMLLVFIGDGCDGFSASKEEDTDRNSRYIEIEEEALKKLQLYPWPGNVRELVTVVERISAVSSGDVITLDMIPERIRNWENKKVMAYSSSNELIPSGGGSRIERIKKVLSLCNGNKTAAARWLGISRGTLYKELRRAGLFGIASQDEPPNV